MHARVHAIWRLLLLSCVLFSLSMARGEAAGFADEITSITPNSGPHCSLVTINGKFSPASGLGVVRFISAPADNAHLLSGQDKITANVPQAAVAGRNRLLVSTRSIRDALGDAQSISGAFKELFFFVDASKDPATPSIDQFGASPNPVIAGMSTTLSWSTSKTTNVELTGSQVAPSGSEVVKPMASTTYAMTAFDSCITRMKQVSVSVIPAVVTFSKIAMGTALLTTPIVIEHGKTGLVFANIPNDNATAFSVSCSSATGPTCVPVDVPAGTKQVTLVVSVPATAPFVTTPVTVTATSLGAQSINATGEVQVKVGRTTGPFSQVKATIGTVATAMIGQYGQLGFCGVTISSGGAQNAWQATIECGGKTVTTTYSAYGNAVLSQGTVASLGGIGGSPTANPNVAVVFSDMQQYAGDKPVGVTAIPLPALFPIHSFKISQAQVSSTGEPLLAQAEYLASPDGSVAVLVGVNPSTGGAPFTWAAVDLISGSTLKTETFNCATTSVHPTCIDAVSSSIVTAANTQMVSIIIGGGLPTSVPLP